MLQYFCGNDVNGTIKHVCKQAISQPQLHLKLLNTHCKLGILAKSTNAQLFAMTKSNNNSLNSLTQLMFQQNYTAQ